MEKIAKYRTVNPSMTEVITENQIAKQDMNAMHLRQTGAKSQKSIIEWFIAGTLPFQILSAIFSGFGFYYDFLLGLGIIAAIILGVLLGMFIEVSKHYAVKGVFSDMEWMSRVIMGGVAFIFMVIAISYHYKSLTNFKNVSVKQDLQTQVNFEREQLLKSSNNIEKLLENNKALAVVLNNGNGGDDYLATEGIISNNELMSQLTTLTGSSYASKELLKQSKKTADSTSSTLLYLFITMEFFSLLGVIGKVMLNRNTSKSVQSLTTTMDRLNTMEANSMLATETALINNTIVRIDSNINRPTPPSESYKQESGSPLPFMSKGASNVYFMDYVGRNMKNINYAKYLPVIVASNDANSDCHGQNNEENEDKEQKVTEVLDLMKFSMKENEIIKAIYENGMVKKGDRCLQKTNVRNLFSEDRLVSRKDIDNLYGKLEDMGYINFRGGYRALVNMENIVSQNRGGAILS